MSKGTGKRTEANLFGVLFIRASFDTSFNGYRLQLKLEDKLQDSMRTRCVQNSELAFQMHST